MTKAIEKRESLLAAFYQSKKNAGVSFFDLHPEQFDFAAAVTSIESRRAALKRQSAMTAAGTYRDGLVTPQGS